MTGARLAPAAPIRSRVWHYDFVRDRDAADRMVRCPTVKDEAAAYAVAVAVEPGCRFSAQNVRGILERSLRRYGVPACLCGDRGGKFIANETRARLTVHGVHMLHSDPDEPWYNALSESFKGTFRRGCLNVPEFISLAEAKVIIDNCRRICSEIRPHSGLGFRPPASAHFLERAKAA